MPQLSKSVQLTHLRIAVTSDAAITLAGSDEPGVALPGEGKGKQAEPVLDKLSALIAAMNDKYGADLSDADKVWVDQQWVVVKADDDMRTVAAEQRPKPVRAGADREDQAAAGRAARQERPAVRPVLRQPGLPDDGA